MVKLFSGSDDYPPSPTPAETDAEAFKKDLFALYAKHGLSISHQDNHGAFIITDQRLEKNQTWMEQATVDIRYTIPEPEPEKPFNPTELNEEHDYLYKEDEE